MIGTDRSLGMAIKGLSNNNNLGRYEIKVFKGTRKIEKIDKSKKKPDGSDYTYEIQGEDYNAQKLRIATTNEYARSLLKCYGNPDKNGDIIATSIKIYLPFDEIEKCFETSLQKQTASGLELICDRDSITHEMVTEKDCKGNVCRQLKEVDAKKPRPCPVAGKHLGYECPNGCKARGTLSFYIREIYDTGNQIPCRLITSSKEDLYYFGDNFSGALASIRNQIGSICLSPFPVAKFKHHIPFILTRTEVPVRRPQMDEVEGSSKKTYVKNGKKVNSTTWALSIQVDPEYMALFEMWRQMEEMRRFQLPVSSQAIAGLLRGDTSTVIDVEVVETRQLPPAKPQLPPVEIWKTWTGIQDAIAWAKSELPEMSEEELGTLFDSVQPDANGKKAPVWVKTIQQLKVSF